jgi:hypothetical protein
MGKTLSPNVDFDDKDHLMELGVNKYFGQQANENTQERGTVYLIVNKEKNSLDLSHATIVVDAFGHSDALCTRGLFISFRHNVAENTLEYTCDWSQYNVRFFININSLQRNDELVIKVGVDTKALFDTNKNKRVTGALNHYYQLVLTVMAKFEHSLDEPLSWTEETNTAACVVAILQELEINSPRELLVMNSSAKLLKKQLKPSINAYYDVNIKFFP